MSGNPVTTHKINGIVYDLRHWKMALFVGVVIMPVVLLARVLSGRNIWGGGRHTDATFFRRARGARKGWWEDKSGAARAGCRIAGIAVLWLWFVLPVVVYILAACELVVLVLWGLRRYRERQHEKTVLRPVWPAVAGIIGIPEGEPPTRWLDIPHAVHTDPTRADAVITVGLRAADADDERRVAALVQLFDQRYGPRRHYGRVDYARRLVHVALRPPEPPEWSALANVLGLPASELAADWLYIPADTQPGAQITVRLPHDVWDHGPMRDHLSRFIDQNFPGEWSATVKHADSDKSLPKRVVLTRQPPEATPPRYVDFFTFDEAQGVN